MLYIYYTLLLLKYFVVIKKEEIVALWIDFDDYKVFEEVTNDFGLKKDLLFIRSKIIISSSPNSKASRARTEDLWSIGDNFNIFGCVFWKKIMFIKLSRPHGSTQIIWGWTARYFLTDTSNWVDPISRPLCMSRPLLLCTSKLQNNHFLFCATEVDPMSRLMCMSRSYESTPATKKLCND